MSSLDSLAQALADGLGAGWPDTDLVRLLADAVHEFELLDGEHARVEYLAEPRSTGSRTWDAVMAALAVHLVRMAGLDRVPTWTLDPSRYSPQIAWLGLPPDSGMQAYVFQRTPIYFKARGIMLNEANLESV